MFRQWSNTNFRGSWAKFQQNFACSRRHLVLPITGDRPVRERFRASRHRQTLQEFPMFVRSKTDDTQAQHGIFGDEEAAELRATLSALTEQVDELQAQMRSQFTATATHASIAQEQADFVKREARSELEQTRSTLIGLIEQVRAEVRSDTDSVDPLPAPSGAPAIARFTAGGLWSRPREDREPTRRRRTGRQSLLRPPARAGRHHVGGARHRDSRTA